MEEKKQNKTWRITVGPSKKHHSEFEFWLGELGVQHIKDAVGAIVVGKNQGKNLGDVKGITFECDIIDNVAHLQIKYQNNGDKEINCSFDEFGGIARGNGKVRKYEGYAQDCLRGIMSKRFGTSYDAAVEAKFGTTVSQD